MLEMLFFGGLMVFALPLALLGAIAYLGFWLFGAVLKTAGAVVGTVLAVVFCIVVLIGLAFFGIVLLPFLMFL
jgi:hypothetical protein